MPFDPSPPHAPAARAPLARPPSVSGCINPPLAFRFRGLISDAQHLSVETIGRRVVSAPRLRDLPVAFEGRLLIDPVARSASFTFVGGGTVDDDLYSFGFEIGNLWDGLIAGGWPRASDALAGWWERPVEIRDIFHDRNFSLWLDPQEQTGGFRWKQSDRAADAPAWLDRSAIGTITQARPQCLPPAELRAV